MRKYEIMYILNASLEEERLTEEIEKINNVIPANGGDITKVDDWGLRNFAYEINHKTKGHYVVVSFDGSNDTVSELDRIISINRNVVRYMITKLEK